LAKWEARQSGMAWARLKSKCVQGATTEISRRTRSASAIALAQADSAPRPYSSSFVRTRAFCAPRFRARATLGISIFSASRYCASADQPRAHSGGSA
jgi:hypothetical protein